MKKLSLLLLAASLLIASTTHAMQEKKQKGDYSEENGESKKSKKEQDSRILEATRKGSLNSLKELLDNDVDIETKDEFGNTCLGVAIIGGDYKVAEFLLQNGADVNAKMNTFRGYKQGIPILMWAIINQGMYGQISDKEHGRSSHKCIMVLINATPNLAATNRLGNRTILDEASMQNKSKHSYIPEMLCAAYTKIVNTNLNPQVFIKELLQMCNGHYT